MAYVTVAHRVEKGSVLSMTLQMSKKNVTLRLLPVDDASRYLQDTRAPVPVPAVVILNLIGVLASAVHDRPVTTMIRFEYRRR